MLLSSQTWFLAANILLHCRDTTHEHTYVDSCISWVDFSFRFKSIVGIGVGAGAYVLAKFAVSHVTGFYSSFFFFLYYFRRVLIQLSLLSADLPWPGGRFGSAQHRSQWQRLDWLGCYKGTCLSAGYKIPQGLPFFFFGNNFIICVSAVRSHQCSARHCAVTPFQPGEHKVTTTNIIMKRIISNQKINAHKFCTYLLWQR